MTTQDAIKVARQPLAWGMTRWGPLPETADLFLFWGGPGDGLFMVQGESGSSWKRIEHLSASGTYDTVKHAQGAVDAFVAAFYADEVPG